MQRRMFLQSLAALSAGTTGIPNAAAEAAKQPWRIATFEADVTLPMGHPCMGGGIAPASSIADPLHARGWVLLGSGQPVVVVSVEWCEIRNEAYESWRHTLAKAAGTEVSHVLVSATHAHDAPVMDYEAERLLRAASTTGSVCDPVFGEAAVAKVAVALKDALAKAAPVTHYSIGMAKVEGVASNRRVILPDGKITHGRMSRCTDPVLRAADDGTIDPWLKTLTFWNAGKAICALHTYAVHPMSYYGKGAVSADFPGLALQAMRESHPGPLHVYGSGCAGNVTAGKYNDGEKATRPLLAARLHEAMVNAWENARQFPLTTLRLRHAELELEPRKTLGFSEAALQARLVDGNDTPFAHCLAAMGLSWRNRVKRQLPISIPCLDLGEVHLMLLPAESYVEYQLYAQQLNDKVPLLVLGYGESAPGYIPTERAWKENDRNLHDWCWVAPGSEARMQNAIRRARGY